MRRICIFITSMECGAQQIDKNTREQTWYSLAKKFGRNKRSNEKCATGECDEIPLDWVVRKGYLSRYFKNEKKPFRELGEEIVWRVINQCEGLK